MAEKLRVFVLLLVVAWFAVLSVFTIRWGSEVFKSADHASTGYPSLQELPVLPPIPTPELSKQKEAYQELVKAYEDRMNSYVKLLERQGEAATTKAEAFELVVKDTFSSLILQFLTAALAYVFVNVTSQVVTNQQRAKRSEAIQPVRLL